MFTSLSLIPLSLSLSLHVYLLQCWIGLVCKDYFVHKSCWFWQLIDTLFSSMTSSFSWSNDLKLFLNVINGCIILHCEDTALLRFSLASLINTSRHFKHIFSMNGSVDSVCNINALVEILTRISFQNYSQGFQLTKIVYFLLVSDEFHNRITTFLKKFSCWN